MIEEVFEGSLKKDQKLQPLFEGPYIYVEFLNVKANDSF